MFWNKKRGLIGVDVGRHAIKVAQLAVEHDRLRLTAAAVCPRPNTATDEPRDLAQHFGAAGALAERLQGGRVAAVLSMNACRVEPSDEEATIPADRCAGSWDCGPTGGYTLSAELRQVESTVEGFSLNGWQCETIDGQPLTIARALQLSSGYDRKELLGAIDLGETGVTFIAATDGLAKYVRRLGCGGMTDLHHRVAESLTISPEECSRLLRRRGVRQPPVEEAEQRVLHDAVKDAVRPLVAELHRTLEHLGGKLKRRGPDRVLVFGAGGAVEGLPELIGSSLGVEAEAWRASSLIRDEGVPDVPDCLLAQSIALSALAWKRS